MTTMNLEANKPMLQCKFYSITFCDLSIDDMYQRAEDV
jgi:hypothetical protein